MQMLPKDAQSILTEIEKALYKPTPKEDNVFKSIENAIKNDWRLSETEKALFKSIENAIKNDWRLSEKQSKWIQDIYAKSTEGKG